MGGALQHGALCAREYGKPGVSGIDIASLETGMKVSVDGNTGVVRILDDNFVPKVLPVLQQQPSAAPSEEVAKPSTVRAGGVHAIGDWHLGLGSGQHRNTLSS